MLEGVDSHFRVEIVELKKFGVKSLGKRDEDTLT